jgi:hypothetical protein
MSPYKSASVPECRCPNLNRLEEACPPTRFLGFGAIRVFLLGSCRGLT